MPVGQTLKWQPPINQWGTLDVLRAAEPTYLGFLLKEKYLAAGHGPYR